MGDIELKPCPFCGGEAKLLEGNWNFVYCRMCEAEGGWHYQPEEAIEAWNKRYEQA